MYQDTIVGFLHKHTTPVNGKISAHLLTWQVVFLVWNTALYCQECMQPSGLSVFVVIRVAYFLYAQKSKQHPGKYTKGRSLCGSRLGLHRLPISYALNPTAGKICCRNLTAAINCLVGRYIQWSAWMEPFSGPKRRSGTFQSELKWDVILQNWTVLYWEILKMQKHVIPRCLLSQNTRQAGLDQFLHTSADRSRSRWLPDLVVRFLHPPMLLSLIQLIGPNSQPNLPGMLCILEDEEGTATKKFFLEKPRSFNPILQQNCQNTLTLMSFFWQVYFKKLTELAQWCDTNQIQTLFFVRKRLQTVP